MPKNKEMKKPIGIPVSLYLKVEDYAEKNNLFLYEVLEDALSYFFRTKKPVKKKRYQSRKKRVRVLGRV